MTFELVKALAPHLAIRLEPGVKFDERFGTEAVKTALTVRAHAHESDVAQNPQVFRHRWLAHVKSIDEQIHRTFTVT
jgi:hypothetical protein